MKSNSLTLLALPFLSLGFLAGSAAAESAREIALKHEQEKATEIAAYLEKNPDAEDKDEARALLITAYRATGQSDKAAVLLRARYDELPKGVDAPLEVMIGEVVHPLIEALQKVGDKEGALAFIETVKTDLKPHPASGQINQFLDQFAGMLNLPGVGEVIEIAGETTKGHPYDLAEMKGKVVLV
ncbi:MAG: hypothetical protein KDM91_13070, partial [Verrucomicrobiae bacterium]|nr:hypothetical protein [Verrucomicrobiae bacterium]